LDPRASSLLKVGGRIVLSAAALYLVFRQIDPRQVGTVLVSANPLWLIGALIAYLLSKVLSAYRLNYYFLANQIELGECDNIKLYLVGMFYNLFLPGGIGGDAYKIWWLHREGKAETGAAIQSVLFDRINGMVLLAMLALAFAWVAFPVIPGHELIWSGILLALPGLFLLQRVINRSLNAYFVQSTLFSAATQGLQLVCAWMLLSSLGVHEQIPAYLTIFFVSSVVSILPISIGGVGIRELVFVTAATYSPIARDVSVGFSLLFFLVTALCSLPGGFMSMREKGNRT